MNTPIAYTIAEACSLSRTGKTVLYQAMKQGQLKAVKRGRRTLILAEDLEKWVQSFPPFQSDCPDGRKSGSFNRAK